MAVAAAAPAQDIPDLTGYPSFLRPHVAAPSVYYAGFWVRVGINVVDAALQALLYLVVNYVLSAVSGIIGGIFHLSSSTVATGTSVVAAIAVLLYYNLVLVARHASSPGMRLASLRIVSDRDITVVPERRTLYLRGVIYLVFSLITPLRLIDALVIAFDPHKRSLHDMLVGTTVVRRAPSAPRVGSLLCTVCGRPVDEGTLCPKHGGSMGLALTLSGHTISLQIAASLLAVVGVLGVVVGIVLLLSKHPAGVAGIVVGLLLLRVTMSLTQLRSWARWAATAAGVAIAITELVLGGAEIGGSRGAGVFLLVGSVVGILIVGCLWTPQTHRSFRRIAA